MLKMKSEPLDSLLFTRESLQDFSNGLKTLDTSNASFKALKHITVSSRVNYTERWYFNHINKSWDGKLLNTDTLNRFKRAYNYNFSTSLNTKLYGIIQMKKGLSEQSDMWQLLLFLLIIHLIFLLTDLGFIKKYSRILFRKHTELFNISKWHLWKSRKIKGWKYLSSLQIY